MDAVRAEPFEPAPAVRIVATSGGSEGRTALMTWGLVLLAFVGVAALGRFAGVESRAPTAAVVFDPPARPTAAPALPTPSPLPDLIVLASPAQAGITVTTRALLVRGYVKAAAATVRVTLEARGNRVIDDATVRPYAGRGEQRAAVRQPWFEVEFGLPNPRPNGRMIVQVVAFDRNGRLLDVVRRPFRVGVVLDGS